MIKDRTRAERWRRWYSKAKNRRSTRQRLMTRYYQRDEAGLCLRCGAARDREFKVCSACAEVAAIKLAQRYQEKRAEMVAYKKNRYATLRAEGKCTVCGRKQPLARCRLCRIKRAA